ASFVYQKCARSGKRLRRHAQRRRGAPTLRLPRTHMAFAFSLDDLLAYSDWDSAQWHGWFRDQGPDALAVSLGAKGDGRDATVGRQIRPQLRWPERNRGRARTAHLFGGAALRRALTEVASHGHVGRRRER